MPSLRQIRRRIRSVDNTGKLTRAMELVAATKMRRAQAAVLATRPYADKMRELLSHLAAMVPAEDPAQLDPLLQRRDVKRIEVVHITPDRGLCGALPSAMNRRTGTFVVEASAPVSIVCVGRKGRDFMVRYGREVRAVFTGVSDRPALLDTTPISRVIIDDFVSRYADAVYIAYSQFVNTAVQRPVLRQLLPVEPAPLPPSQLVGYIYEPQPRAVFSALLPRYIEMQMYQAILESNASEQSARMVAMRNATENASDLVRELTLLANKVRQAAITSEILDIIGGSWGLQTR
ncbi:MAG: ATP synthase F1 subunit gamma [Chloroflexi bacterium]|nr:ATP synthase F1 subunit gamma [Chloroflexota bacterium]